MSLSSRHSIKIKLVTVRNGDQTNRVYVNEIDKLLSDEDSLFFHDIAINRPNHLLSSDEVSRLKSILEYQYIELHGNVLRFRKRMFNKKYNIPLDDFVSYTTLRAAWEKVIQILGQTEEEIDELEFQRKSLTRSGARKTFSYHFAKFLDYWSLGKVGETSRDIGTVGNRLINQLGECPLHKLDQTYLESWIKSANEKYSQKTISKDLTLLNKFVAWLLANRHLSKSTIDFKLLRDGIKGCSSQKPVAINNGVLNEEAIEAIKALDYATLKSLGLHIIRDLTVVQVESFGLRPSEGRTLAVEDFFNVNVDGTLHEKLCVNRARVQGRWKTPKVVNSTPWVIDVWEGADEALNRLKSEAENRKAIDITKWDQAKGEYIEETFTPLVVNPKTGKIYSDDQFRKEFKRLLEFAGIEYIPPKQLRASFATRAIMKGVAEETVARQLTHVTYKTTREFYCYQPVLNTVEEKEVAQRKMAAVVKLAA